MQLGPVNGAFPRNARMAGAETRKILWIFTTVRTVVTISWTPRIEMVWTNPHTAKTSSLLPDTRYSCGAAFGAAGTSNFGMSQSASAI